MFTDPITSAPFPWLTEAGCSAPDRGGPPRSPAGRRAGARAGEGSRGTAGAPKRVSAEGRGLGGARAKKRGREEAPDARGAKSYVKSATVASIYRTEPRRIRFTIASRTTAPRSE
jgi:hypothetical protein